MEKISTKQKRFVDLSGRERVFNGINIHDRNTFIGKENTYIFDTEPEFFEKLAQNGINLIRFVVSWSCIEPEPGKYDEHVLNEMQNVLDDCSKHGIHAFIDMHQDLYSSFGYDDIEEGDGAPLWACLTDGYKYRKKMFVWAEGYFFGKAVHRAFDNFWNNTPYQGRGIQDRYCDMWKMLAARFGEHPALFGFDLMNEPFPGTDGGKVFKKIVGSAIKVTLTDKSIKKGKLIASAFKKNGVVHILKQYDSAVFRKITASSDKLIEKFDKGYYTSFLNRAAAAVRSETDNGILMLENSYYSNMGIPFHGDSITLNGKREENQAFAPHGYDLMVDTPLYKYADNERTKAIFEQRKKEQDDRLKMPVIVGEWGGKSDGTGQSEGTQWLPHIEFLLNYFDQNKWSHTYWDYRNGLFDTAFLTVLNRPYPRAVTGEIDSYIHDRDANTFELIYKQDKTYDAPTEIYAHREVESVETDGSYEIEPLGKDSSLIKIHTEPGTHTVKIKFSGNGFSFTAENGRI